MAESTLSLTYNQLREEVAVNLGHQRASSWDSELLARLNSVIESGLRQFYWPEGGHVWSFLRPLDEVVVWGSITGTMTVTTNTTITDATNAPFYPTVVGQTLVVDIAPTHVYVITGYTSASVITVATDATADTGRAFTITNDGRFPLPDDCAGLQEPLTFAESEGSQALDIVPQWQINEAKQVPRGVTRPAYAAVTPRPFDPTVGQRFDLILWPQPGSVYHLTYTKVVLPNELSAANKYAYGGAQHAETVLASCLAVAEARLKDQPGGPLAQDYMRRLEAAIAADTRNKAYYFGYNGDRSDMVGEVPRRTSTGNATYLGGP